MWTTILAFLGTFQGKAALAGVGVWALGLFSRSVAYRKVREGIGRVAYAIGARLSGFATARLGRLTWAPIENALADFLGFGVEQFFAGLRSDNVEKLETRLETLEAVGSEARAKAVAQKLAALSKSPEGVETPADAAVFAQALAAGDASARERLGP